MKMAKMFLLNLISYSLTLNVLICLTFQWSYGVLLWELLTRGVTPYPDVDNSDLPGYLETGNRMKKPRQCPENM